MRYTVAEGLARIPGPAGQRFATLLTRGTLELELYAPRGTDPQQPHRKDELYVVVSGSGIFVCDDQRTPFGPGDCLFAAAGAIHRFESFSDDLVAWVVFWGPEGGERPRG